MIKSPLEDIQFPQYRKYSNNKNYFKICSATEFEEVQVIGSKSIKRQVVAVQFPEKMFIMDLVLVKDETIEVIMEGEYKSVL
jgi:predicted nuclease of restriction endonuclease-like RecB superfamily